MAHDQEPTPAVVTARRRRWPRITLVTVGLLSASALLAVPAIAQSDGSDPTPTPAPAAKVVVCESGIVDHGDGIQTSSASAERVPADAPVPEGCTAE